MSEDISVGESLAAAVEQDDDTVEGRVAIARRLLRELAADALPVLQARNRGKALEASLTPRRLSRRFLPGRGNYQIHPGRVVWRLGAKAVDRGITEDGVLGITDDGELVRMSTWLRADGDKRIDPRGQGSRFRDRLARTARARGCDGTVSVSEIEAYGEPQPETRFLNREFRNVFYLDTGGKLVFGHTGAAVSADEWFTRTLPT